MSKATLFKKKSWLLGASILAAVLSSGCSTVNVEKTKEEQLKKADKASRIIENGMKVQMQESAISVSNKYYIAEKPIRLDERDMLPEFFYKPMVFKQSEPVALQELISIISDRFNVRIEFTSDAAEYAQTYASKERKKETDTSAEDALKNNDLAILEDLIASTSQSDASEGLPATGIKFAIEHNGNLSELLDRVTGRVGLYWEWSDNQISVFRTKSQVIKADINAISENFSSSFKSSNGSGVSSTSTFNVKYDGNPILALNNALTSLLTDDGKITIMPSMNMIVVNDIPTKVKEVVDLVEKINIEATTQIAVRLDIIKVTHNDSNDFGIGWDAIFNGSSEYGFEFVSQLTNSATSNLKLGFINPTGNFSGSEAFLNALQENGLTTKHYTTFGQTSNGRSLPLIDEESKAFIKSLSTEVSESGVVSTDTVTENAVTGIDVNILPKVTSQNKVSMDIKFSISEVVDLEERNFDGNQLQLPTSANMGSTLSPVLEPGKTYMIGGNVNSTEQSNNSSITGGETVFDWILGGRKESSEKRVQTILLVTPHIVSN